MIFKDENGKIIGSIEFTEKELDLEKEKFEKIADLGNKFFENEKIKMETIIKNKEENTKRMDKITTVISETLHEIADVMKDIKKHEQHTMEWNEDQYNKEDPIDTPSVKVKGKSIIDLDLS